MPFVLFIWMRIKVRKDLWWSITIGFIGVIFILRPKESGFADIGTLLALSSGMLAAFTLLAVRELAQTEPNTRILFYYFLVMTLATLPFALASWMPLSLKQWLILLMIGVMG